ncbi:phage tail assembly chaperone [Xenorhabdus sp. XENO-1]|uniref:phage tail assembly chaperone n=1 Tax=Xenorhabdus bovienii TaxID=40576 RepID=UPI0020CA9368|nr:phage tail assembly chaperone [Xenorhabdus bovienii]MCP9269843.1 phage tail assembly chaperone [Xenorhabdus bovienii subsp. africana]
MAKFTLVPNPKFKADVQIPVAGQEKPEIVTFTFHHKPISELDKMREMPAQEFFEKIVAGWAIEEPYNAENLKLLLDNYPSATTAITTTYYNELLGNREKN